MAPGDNYLAAKQSFYGTPNQLRDQLARLISGENPDGSDYSPPILSRSTGLPFINIKSTTYGALGDGVANDTAAISAALTALSTAGGGTIYFPKGTYLTDPFLIPSNVILYGDGWKSILKRRSGTTGRFIGQVVGATQITLRDLTIDGNGGGFQGSSGTLGGDATCHALFFDYNGESPANTYDQRLRLDHLFVTGATGHGIFTSGRPENWITGCLSYKNAANNYRIGDENYITNCISGRSGDDGFAIVGVGSLVVGCKSWWSGRNHTTYGGTASGGNGFTIRGNHPTSDNRGNVLAACNGQDNLLAGFLVIDTTQQHLVNCHADNNNLKRTDDDVTIAAFNSTGPGFDIWDAFACRIIGSVGNRPVTGQLATQSHALRIRQTSANNRIDLVGEGLTTGWISSSSNAVAGNDLRMGGQGSYTAPAFAATTTPDPYTAEFWNIGALTSDITIANPAAAHIGQMLEISVTQDATGGRKVTWGNLYKAVTAASKLPNQRSAWRFRYDGTNWVVVSTYSQLVRSEKYPADYGVKAWTGPPHWYTNNSIPGAGTVRLMRMKLEQDALISKIIAFVFTPSNAGNANTFFGLYRDDGAGNLVLVAKTADQSTDVQAAAGLRQYTLTAEAGESLNIAGGPDVYVYWAVIQGTGATLALTRSITTAGQANMLLTATDGFEAGNFGSALTALPSTITKSAITSGSACYQGAIV